MKRWILFLSVLAVGFFPGVFVHGNLNITKVGEWGTGYYKDIFIQGNYAYCVAGKGGLDIIDISDPGNPWKIGNYKTVHSVKRVYVKGNYAYVTGFNGGLKVLDVSNPSSPVLVGSYGQFCADGLYVEGNFAYMTVLFEGLFIIDISEPSSPVPMGTYPIKDEPGRAVINHNLYVSGNYVYIIAVSRLLLYGDYSGELLILDISIPASPRLVGTYDNLLQPGGIHVKEQYAYIADERSGFQVVDISDKSHPIMAGNWQEPFGTSTVDVYVVGNYAYVGNSAAGVMVFDISSHSKPVLLGSVGRNAIPYRVRGNYAYTAYNSKGLQVIDIQDPSSSSSISLVGSYDIDKEWGFEAAIGGHYAYIYGSFHGLLFVIDISNPSSPVLVGKIDFVESVRDIHLQGDYVYASVGHAGFYVVDISTPFPQTVPPSGSGWTVFPWETRLTTGTGRILPIYFPVSTTVTGRWGIFTWTPGNMKTAFIPFNGPPPTVREIPTASAVGISRYRIQEKTRNIVHNVPRVGAAPCGCPSISSICRHR
jgi:hypothetical protein